MKKRVLLRIAGIGVLHTFLYLWFVPFVIYPRFGDNGFKMTIAVTVLISMAILGTLFIGKKSKDITASTFEAKEKKEEVNGKN